jgi:hypothetical protein
MNNIFLTDNQLNSNGFWSNPINKKLFIPLLEDIELFDQNGYDLTNLEQRFAESNDIEVFKHRSHRVAIKSVWFDEHKKPIEGPHLNHSLLFERKAYSGQALDQLIYWSKTLPVLNKIIALRPKWGIDFSMDYADQDGNSFEILHWEYDSFSYEEISDIKLFIEPILESTDWDFAAGQLLKNKSEWHHLDFFQQSDWKCNYFGIPKEKFKMVSWK